LAVTLGEPAGIGPDIVLKAWLQRDAQGVPPFYIVGDLDFLMRRARQLNVDVPLAIVEPDGVAAAFVWRCPVVPLDVRVTAQAGTPDASSAPAAVAAIRRAVGDVVAGRAAAVVTNPVAKSVLYRNGFGDPGHTEYLARLAKELTGVSAHPVMMLWAPELAVVPVTVHLPISEVPARLTRALIEETGRIVARELRQRFGIAHPRLVAAGLNPHAGEDGGLGAEDRDIVAPALATLRHEGIAVRGPLPADTLFHAQARASYDAALCMYHDQALIPIKTLAFDHAVNVTLGLPFVRTSPDHGTAFDIAGTGSASAGSLIAALKLAERLADAHAPAPAA
jgi:4-hydroxythreonine-4-phosphate dehydrogenase